MNSEGLTLFNPTTGDVVSEFRGENLTFRDAAGNALTRLDNSGMHVFDAAGNEITTIDDEGLTISDNLGAAQLKAGNLGAGDYGVEIGGGRARAIDIARDFKIVTDVSLSTTLAAKTTINFTPPSWATEAIIIAGMTFQMSNPAGGMVRQLFRIDVDGIPGSGAQSNDVQAGDVQLSTDMQNAARSAPLPSPIVVDAMAAVHTGTNSTNIIRLAATAFFLR